MTITPESKRDDIAKMSKPIQVSLRDINSEYIRGNTIAVEGKAVAISEPEIIVNGSMHRCQNCLRVYTRKVQKCEDWCGSSDIKKESDLLEDLQIIRIQEIKPRNSNIAKLIVIVRGKDNMWRVRAGQHITAVGKLEISSVKLALDGKEKPVKRLEATELSVIGSMDNEYVPTELDIERFKKDINEPLFYDKLRASFAPFLVNMDEIKDACLLTLASIKTTRPLNFLMVGDPSKAKSVIMEYLSQIADNGHFASGANTTWAGLSITSEKDHDTEAWILKYGLLPLADEGLAAIDEIQNYKEDELMKMNEVLESKKVSYAKAGGNSGDLPSRCAVILACNPHHGKWMKGANLQDNLRFMGRAREAFISRMAIIFILQDEVDEVNDRAVAQSVIENSGEELFRKYHEDSGELWGSQTIKKFFAWIVSQTLPQIPPELYEELITFYTAAREKGSGMITPRYLKDAIRLAQMKARILGKEKIDNTDVKFAVDLLDKSLNEAAFDPKTQKVDPNIIQGTLAASTQAERANKEDQFFAAYEKACMDKDGNNRGYAELLDILFWLTSGYRWPDNHKTERYIENMLTRSGRFMEKHGQGKWSKIE